MRADYISRDTCVVIPTDMGLAGEDRGTVRAEASIQKRMRLRDRSPGARLCTGCDQFAHQNTQTIGQSLAFLRCIPPPSTRTLYTVHHRQSAIVINAPRIERTSHTSVIVAIVIAVFVCSGVVA